MKNRKDVCEGGWSIVVVRSKKGSLNVLNAVRKFS